MGAMPSAPVATIPGATLPAAPGPSRPSPAQVAPARFAPARLPPGRRSLVARARAMLAQEGERLALWTPVALGCGIACYFAMPWEPWPAIAAMAAIACGLVALAAAWLAVPRPARLVLAALALCLAGAALAQQRAASVAAPVLAKRWGPAELRGRIVSVEARPDGRRLVLDRLEMPGLGPGQVPARVRVKLRAGSGEGLAPGDVVAARAQLVPPPGPAAPGAYDFARWAWFERIGGVGSLRGAPRLVERDAQPGWRIELNALRADVVRRVLAADPGPAGQVTAALLTGEMGHVDPALMQAMRDSGLAHLLSISGLHITLVAGIVFFAVRRAIALVPRAALRWPAKKIAACCAFAAITAYMLFAAPGVPTTRAWFMGGLALLAILLDRAPVSMRLVAWAALAVLATTPEALLGPSFQMSFAAVVALVAAWEWLAPGLRRLREASGVVLRGALLVAGALATSLVAGIATAPFGIYHFNRMALFSIAANLLAVPLTSFVVMPCAVLVFLALPLGGEALPLAAMNAANLVVVQIATEVAAWPSAALMVPAMPDWGLACCSLGGLWLALWRSGWRALGVPVVVAGLASPWLASPPDIVAGAEARLVGIRGGDGGLALHGRGNVQMAAETWLRRAGQARAAAWPPEAGGAAQGTDCRAGICWIERDGHLVAVVASSAGLAEACAWATALVTTLEVRRACPAPAWVLDRRAILDAGGIELRLAPGGGLDLRTTRAVRGDRPWAMPAPGSAAPAEPQ